MNPYVPSEKTDGKSDDRRLIDAQVEIEAQRIADNTPTNFSVLEAYKALFNRVASNLLSYENGDAIADNEVPLARVIYEVGNKYRYQGAFLGELNYAITRLIQRVPQFKVARGDWQESSELRYWYYAVTVEALTVTSKLFLDSGAGIGGVFEDIKDEYKRRVNTSYEAAQIIKSGDCYDTPYYTRLIEVLDADGKHVGYQEVMVKRSLATLNKDILDDKVTLGRLSTQVPVTADHE